ncbi:MAG: SDR family NAD(P)-dependent oxidoreductase [Deltaproteobacteria bacterium]|nr:SDR family NAD(P)-dependent oxidoreductase [Deltaproteobacteria bacterium]
MACRFPGAPDPTALWRLLVDGIEALDEVPPQRWPGAAHVDADRRAPGKMVTARGGYLPNVTDFDPDFFGISPREASQIDPQQRLALELAWEALEDAAVRPASLRGSATGVFMGAMWHDYERLHQLHDIEQHSGTGWHLGVIPGRVSYALGLRGPSMAINTACSSSLVAIHLACKALLEGEATMALAGGVSLMLTPHVSVAMSKFGGTSPSGRCFSYDARADGYVRGEGGGVVVLRRLHDAIEAGDRIFACIRASAVNNDGASEGLTVPSGAAQRSLLRDVYARSGVSPAAVGFVEGHGTGTAVGDPIEAQTLGQVLGDGRSEPLWLGSIKPNIGHTEAASGVASLIKATLAVHRGLIPPNLNFEHPNPAIDFDALKIRVPTTVQSWRGRRWAGVNSFGFGGTNCHLVIGERPSPTPVATAPMDGPHLLTVSGHTESAASARMQQLCAVAQHEGVSVGDVAHTLLHRRDHLEYRMALVVRRADEITRAVADDRVLRGQATPSPAIAFAFSGQGSQWTTMGQRLWTTRPAFARALRQCSAVMEPMIGWSIARAVAEGDLEPHLQRVDGIQPAIFAMQCALCETWRSLGVVPGAVVGHSMGEVAAAVAAGALRMEDGARITCARAKLLARISGQGGMLSLALPVERAREVIARRPGLCVAVDGGIGSTVVSGDHDGLRWLAHAMEAQGIEHRAVRVDVAAHSPQIDAIADELLAAIEDIRPRSTSIRMISSVTAGPVDYSQLLPEYWVSNLRDPVWFGAAARQVVAEGFDTLVEVSPHPLLVYPLRQLAREADRSITIVGTLRRDRADDEMLLEAVAQLHCRGVDVMHEQPGRPCTLPAYPWQRRRFWPRSQPRPRPVAVDAQLKFDPSRVPALGAHRVQGRSIVSAGVVVDLAMRAWSAVDASGGGVALHSLAFTTPLSGDLPVVLTLAEGLLTVATADDEPGVNARLERAQPDARADQIPSVVGATALTAAQHYAAVEARGVQYGPSLRVIERIAVSDGRADAEIDPCASSAARLDAVFQAVLAATPDGKRYVTEGVAMATLDPQRLATVRRVVATVALHEDSARGRAWLLDGTGDVVGQVQGVRLTALSAAKSVARVHRWMPSPSPERPPNSDSWVVLDGDDRIAARVAKSLGAPRVELPASVQTLAGHRAVVLPIAIGDEALLSSTALACRHVLAAARACVALSELPPLVIITERGETTETNERPCPGPSALQGLVGVLRVEYPGLRIVTIDTADAHQTRWPTIVATALDGREDRIAVRGEAASPQLLVPRLVQSPWSRSAWSVPTRGTVVLSGGLGGIGRAVAGWLVDRGVPRVLLLGRRELDDEARGFLHALRARGGGISRVDHAAVDIGDRSALEAVLPHPTDPVVGVIHAAAVLGDAPALALDPATLRSVLWPKLEGAWNLHHATRNHELDHFVMFSSLGGWVGLPGQAAYAAANAFLDGLAAHRRTQGLRGTSIGWCGWEGLGFARTAGGSASLQRLARDGIGTLPAHEAFDVLEHALAGDVPPAFAVMPPHRAPASSVTARLDALRGQSIVRQRAALTEHVLTEVAAVLREDIARVDPGRPLRELGLDSLMSVELAERLGRRLDVEVSTTLIWRYPTADGLVGHFLGSIAPPSDSTPGVAPPASAEPPTVVELDAIVEQLDDLSDEEVEALTGAL